jgi:hypothetical protein
MVFLKKLKHKTKPPKITPVVHIAPSPAPKKIIHEIKEDHIDKKIVTAAVVTNQEVIQPSIKEIVKISEKTNEVVIQPSIEEIVKISKETDDKIIEPVISSDDKKSKKNKTNEIVEETTTIAPYLIAAGGLITLYMIL